MKEFEEDNFMFKENARKFSKGKGEINCVFKRLILETHKIKGIFGKQFKSKRKL